MPIELKLLILLALANGTPVIAKWLLGARFALALDGNRRFVDGRPLFGPSKTVRGIVLAIAVTAAGAPLLGFDWWIGAVIGAGAMAGDLLSSFTKRRLGMASSSMALGLDQIPEALLPLWLCKKALGLDWSGIALVVGLFLVGELLASRLLFRLHVRDRPY